jgi:argininosuccinate synthase
MYTMAVPVEQAPDRVEYVEVEYEAGNPVAINGRKFAPAALLAEANRIAGAHGVGRIDLVENRYVGMKSRGVYETPGGTLLHAAHRAVESITMDREVLHLRESLIPKYAELVYYGYWFAPERLMLQAAIDESQKNVTGTARLRLYKGNCDTVGRRSPVSLYRPDLATFESETVYDQKDAEGFIRLNALRVRVGKQISSK